MYFEFQTIEDVFVKVKKIGLEIIHQIEEQPWGQYWFRAYDYDDNVLAIAEDMVSCINRLYQNIKSIKEVAKKTGYTEEYIMTKLINK